MLAVALVVEVALVVLARASVPAVALAHVLAFSAAAFAAFSWDKWQAGRGGRRIGETTLLGLTVLGGAAGALAAMLAFRHKTTRALFWFAACVALFAHLTVVGWLFISR
jgi:uncharacterized membrane protein YsdA (DUF1294 family)